jgi:glycosyltransferase involved in cell wall biosynthesis
MAGSHRWQKLCQELPDDQTTHVIAPPPTVPVGEFERTNQLWERSEVDDVTVTRLWTYQPTDDWSSLGRILNYVLFAVHATVYVLLNFWRFGTVVTYIGPHTTLIPGLVANLLGRNWIIDADDLWLDNAVDLGFTDESDVSYRLLAALERISFRRCDHVFVVTPTLGEQYRQKHDFDESKYTAVPFGIDLDMFSPEVASEVHDRIIYTGKFGHDQAFEPFFRGFARLDTDHKLLVVGFGQRREELERLAEELHVDDRVTIRDAVPREKIPELVASSILSWVPLRTDYQLDYARPTKFVESMAVGTPYIASDLPEIAAVASESESGLAVPNEPDEIRAAMETIIEDEEVRREMGENGVEFVSTHHRWETIGAEVSSVISRIKNDR